MKITRKNSQTIIEDYEFNDKLEKSLSVFDYLSNKFTFSCFFKKDDSTIIIPSNYEIEKVYKKEVIHTEYKPIKNRRITFDLYSSLREEQEKIYNELVNSPETQKFLSGRTGIGKSFITLSYIKKKRDLPILFVENKKIRDNWLKEILLHTNILESEIFFISGKDSIEKLMNMNKEELTQFKFFIAIHRTFKLLIDDNPTYINKVMLKLSIGLKIFDEAHNEWNNMVNIDLLTNVKDTIYITSTPYKNDVNENKVYQACFGNIEKFGLSDKYNRKYHNICILKFNSKATKKDIKGMSTFQYPFVSQRYTKYLMKEDVYNTHFINVLLVILKKSKNTDRKTAFIFNNNELINKVYEDFNRVFKNHNITKKIAIFNQGSDRTALEADIILTTDKSFNKAIDVPNLEALVNTVPITGEGSLEQIVGRLRPIKGKDVVFYDVVDVSIPDCRNQLAKRIKLYAKISDNIIDKELIT